MEALESRDAAAQLMWVESNPNGLETLSAAAADVVRGMAALDSVAARPSSTVAQWCRNGRGWPPHEVLVRDVMAESAAHAHLNRYSNICPYDLSRVKLIAGGDDTNTDDYINASHVQLPGQHYVMAQGPLAATSADFWAMVVQQGAAVVVALAKVEGGFTGLSGYWPSAVGDELQWQERGGVTVRCVKCASDEEASAGGIGASVEHRELEVSWGGRVVRVQHLYFSAWPNYGVASECALRRLIELTLQAQRTDAHAPLVVHCSGGVGRSGVFIVAHNAALSRMRGAAPVAPAVLVVAVRRQRHPWAVETDEQFDLLLKVVRNLSK